MLHGGQLRDIFSQLDPFTLEGDLKPHDERGSLLAVNANMPLEIGLRGFLPAAAEAPGSPLIVQVSFNAMRRLGGGGPSAIQRGGELFSQQLQALNREYGVSMLAMALDHYRVPTFPSYDRSAGSWYQKQAQGYVEDASEYLEEQAAIPVATPSLRTDMVNYMATRVYQEFKQELCTLVGEIRPAYVMIDTESLPPVLTAAVARETGELLRTIVGQRDILLEVEYGSTGKSPQATGYVPLDQGALDEYTREVCALVRYTRADAISYPIGLVHGASADEKYEPDYQRLFAVQGKLKEDLGLYVPFVQHGGSGARSLMRGLVGKNNLNTTFLIAGAQAISDYVKVHDRAVSGGKKEACAGMFMQATAAIRRELEERLDEAGTRRANTWLEVRLSRA